MNHSDLVNEYLGTPVSLDMNEYNSLSKDEKIAFNNIIFQCESCGFWCETGEEALNSNTPERICIECYEYDNAIV